MTSFQRTLARHALGLDGPKMKSYRNYYSTYSISNEYPLWKDMVDKGLAKSNETTESNKSIVFWLTEEGAVQALDKGESLDREDFPGQGI